MKKILIVFAAASLLISADAFAINSEKEAMPAEKTATPASAVHIKPYGFFRNYVIYDSRASHTLTQEIFYVLPKDRSLVNGNDVNDIATWKFQAITTRVGFDISGYQYGRAKVGGKVETDFYCMNSGGNVANLRLRQAYMTINWDALGKEENMDLMLKMGQAWHPLAADQPNCINLETGMPFNPFSRTPMALFETTLDKKLTFSVALISQMQYLSVGPVYNTTTAASNEYLKHSLTPEVYLGLSYKSGDILGRAGLDILSIKPRWYDKTTGEKLSDRITTATPFAYFQYTSGDFQFKAKTLYAQAGEHINLLSGYAVSSVNTDGSWEYTPFKSTVSFASVQYGKKWQFMAMIGYVKNLGTAKDILATDAGAADPNYIYLNGNSEKGLVQTYRFTPTVICNLGKLMFGLEYNHSAAQFGDSKTLSRRGVAENDLHWINNERFTFVAKYSF